MAESSYDQLPIFPLSIVLFPGMEAPLHIFEDRYRQLMHDRRETEPAFGVVLITTGGEVGDQPDVAGVGTAASIIAVRDYDDGRHDLVVRGGRRFRLHARNWSRSYLIGAVEWLDDIEDDADAAAADDAWQSFIRLANAYLTQTQQLGMEPMRLEARSRPDSLSATALGFLLASRLPVGANERQKLLEQATTDQLLSSLIHIMSRERRLVSRIGATVVVAGGVPTSASS